MIDLSKYKKSIITLVMFFLTFLCFAQNNYKHYTSSNGLQHDVTYNMLQDTKGYIWIATDDGLSKFDGKDFRNYSLKDGLTSNYVMDIEELSDNKYAIATWGGGLHFLENDTIYKNDKFNDINVKSYDINYFDNKVYTSSGSGLLMYDLHKDEFNSKIYINSEVGFINELRSGLSYKKLKPVVLDDKVYIHNQEQSQNYLKGVHAFSSKYNITPAFSFLSDLEVSTAYQLSKNNYVFASKNRLVFSNQIEMEKIVEVSKISINERIVKILKVPNKASSFVLLIRHSNGQKRFVILDTVTNEMTLSDELIELTVGVSDIMFDFENNLWISTFGNGVYCYYYSNPRVSNILTGEYFVDAVKHEDTVFAQTSSRLFKLVNSELVESYPIEGFAKNLNLIDNELYVSSLRPKSKTNFDFNIVQGRFFDKTKYGVVRQSDTILVNNKAILISNELFIRLVEEADSLINFYTNKGKWIYDLRHEKLSKDLSFQKGFPSERINDLLVIDNVSYIATDKGLVVKNGDELIKIYNSKSGLQNERINCLYAKDNSLYLGTQAGLSVIKNDKVYNFSKSFGVQSLSINKIITLGDNLWLIGNNGISIVNINDVKISNGPKLIVNQESNRFLYEVISFFDQNAIKVEYRINKNQWVAISNLKGELNLSNYAANTYVVEFRTQNGRSDWVSSKEFTLIIHPPWYKIWWILLLCFLCALGIFAFFFYNRFRTISKRNKILKNEIAKRIIAENELEEVRDNIARDFHDDLGNKLASISLLSDVLSSKVETEQSEVAKTIKSDADYLYKGTRDFIFSLQEKSNYIEEIIVYLSDFAEDYLYQFGIDFEAKSNVEENIKLPYYWSKQIIFIYKEAITNTVKYAKASNASMIFNFEKGKLHIEFCDDGIGFELENIKPNGISNMQSRANKIDCVVEVKSTINSGTSIVFNGKLPH